MFKREIAPEIIRTAHRVTLYASSNDAALKVSKEINGFPRAGDSGADLIVMPGLDTIDVSAIDTSLVGHSYYGNNDTVLSDLFYLLSDDRSPDERQFLQPRSYQGLKYWAFTQPPAAAPHVAQPDDGRVLR